MSAAGDVLREAIDEVPAILAPARFIDRIGMPVCKWFLKGEEGANGLICGCRVDAGQAYCSTHRGRAYQAPLPKERR